jgi:dTDP-glucose pyrophosphorylase/CBS domain-containing protein
MKDKDINQYCLKESAAIRECMEVIDRNKQGIALIIDDQGRLIGTVTDGDIRRSILAGRSLKEPVLNVMWTNPLTAPFGASEAELKILMNKYLVRNIPILDEAGCPCKIVNLRDIVFEEDGGQCAVIMAGGEGKRLRPITENIPKPMIKVGEKPILENIIKALTESGIVNIYISINYKADIIEDYFKDGSDYGAKITYLKEDKKLGTAGALTLLPENPLNPLLIINGDIITKTNFMRLIEFHKQHRCVMTVAAIQYMFNIPYGVLKMSEHYLLGIEEKPKQKFLCNAGIYIVNPEILPVIPKNTAFDMTDLIKELARKGLPVSAFPIHEYWIDIGHKDDLKKAQNALTEF